MIANRALDLRPTRLADAPKAGDRVRCVGGLMVGTVLRVVEMGHAGGSGSLAYAVVRWPSSVGRHSITTIERVRRQA